MLAVDWNTLALHHRGEGDCKTCGHKEPGALFLARAPGGAHAREDDLIVKV